MLKKNIYILQHSGSGPQTLSWIDATVVGTTVIILWVVVCFWYWLIEVVLEKDCIMVAVE